MASLNPVFDAVRRLAQDGPLVVAHRGDSSRFAENTLPAFRSAKDLGVSMQEFDVRCTRDGQLVCIHDASADRTSNAAQVLGPGALVAQATLAELRRLDAGSWHEGTGAATIPTLAEVLSVVMPDAIAMIEHKAGSAADYVGELQRLGAVHGCIVQSFDWAFVEQAKGLAPALAVAVLGPSEAVPRPDDAALAKARALGAGMVHWHCQALSGDDVARIHAAGMLVCTYTTDDEAGLRGGAAMGFDAMCTNVPTRMKALRASGCLRRLPDPRRSADQ
jgi:glycerophosphoryl diester phosphodiesterase